MPIQAQDVCRNAYSIFMSTVSYVSSVLSKSEMAGEFLTQFPTVNFMTIHLLIFEFLHGHKQGNDFHRYFTGIQT